MLTKFHNFSIKLCLDWCLNLVFDSSSFVLISSYTFAVELLPILTLLLTSSPSINKIYSILYLKYLKIKPIEVEINSRKKK